MLPVGTLPGVVPGPIETMTDYMHEVPGALATPRNSDMQQSLDRHGTDDTDEYGATPAHSSVTHVTIVGSVKGPELDLTSAQ